MSFSETVDHSESTFVYARKQELTRDTQPPCISTSRNIAAVPFSDLTSKATGEDKYDRSSCRKETC